MGKKWLLNFIVIALAYVTLNVLDSQLRSLHPEQLKYSTIWFWWIDGGLEIESAHVRESSKHITWQGKMGLSTNKVKATILWDVSGIIPLNRKSNQWSVLF